MSNQLVVIDTSVAEYQSLIDQLGSTYSYLLLSADLDGVTQIANYVAATPGFDAIHLISHGSPGLVALGTSTLAGSTLGRYSVQLEQIGASLNAGGDLLIYGCNVAKGDAGQQLVTDISRLTRLDVAASTNTTGGTGDWVLETSVGLTADHLTNLNYAWGLDTLVGTSGSDTISGLAGNDQVDGQAGDDLIYGGDGNDTLEGNYGNDTLYGESGNDTLTDDQGANLLDGGAGTDSLTTRSLSGNSTLVGGLDNDSLNATGLTVSLSGGDGNDSLSVTGALSITNNSTVYVQGGSATLDGGAGNDSLNVNSYSQATLKGGDGDDYLYAGVTRTAELYGEGGKDIFDIYYFNYSSQTTDGNAALSESYVLDGGADDDTLSVSGNSDPRGGQVTVIIRGGTGNDKLTLADDYAGNSTNSFHVGVSQATLEGGDGNDEISVAGVLQATLTGGAGVDTFKLMAQQYNTLLNGPRTITISTGTVNVTADPLTITDFVAGANGDVLY